MLNFGGGLEKNAGVFKKGSNQQTVAKNGPGNPILMRMMQLIRQRFTWKMENTLELTGRK